MKQFTEHLFTDRSVYQFSINQKPNILCIKQLNLRIHCHPNVYYEVVFAFAKSNFPNHNDILDPVYNG